MVSLRDRGRTILPFQNSIKYVNEFRNFWPFRLPVNHRKITGILPRISERAYDVNVHAGESRLLCRKILLGNAEISPSLSINKCKICFI